MRVLLIPLVVGLFPPLAAATDYYVAAEVTGASNENDGLSPTYLSGTNGPFLTVSKACQTVQEGDTVYILDGYYDEWPSVGASGTADNPIRFTAHAGHSPELHTLTIENRSWIEVIGLTFRGHKVISDNWLDMPEVVIDDPGIGPFDPTLPWEGPGGRQELAWQKYATFMDMLKNEWEGPDYSKWSNGISVSGSDNILIQNNRVSHHTIGIALSDGSSQVIVEDNFAEYCRQGMWAWVSSGVSASDCVMRNNECTQNLSGCITVRNAERMVVEGNVSNYAAISQFNMGSGTHDSVLRNNHASHGGFYTETMEHPGSSCISVWTAGERNLVEGNYCAYHLDPTTWDGNGIIIDLSPNGKTIVRRNVLYRNQGSGVTFTASPEVVLYNNVMAENGLNHPEVTPGTNNSNRNGAGLRFAREEDIDHIIMNNIFHLNELSCVYSGGRLLNQPLVDYNFYSPYPGTPLVKDSWNESREFFSLEDIRADSGREEHGLLGDPLFVDTDELDFRLQEESPAIDQGGCLTRTTGSGSGTQVPVGEASFFFPGIPQFAGDQIVVGSNEPVRVTAVDTASRQLTLESSISWEADDPVCLVYDGVAPDMGAHEWTDDCQPATCEILGAECGSIDDGCGATLDCGTCPDGETCGAEEPNVCGEETCVPRTCQELGDVCGEQPDGCGDTLDCGECEDQEQDSGCSCGTEAGSQPLGWALLPLALWLFRRSRRTLPA